MSISAHFRVCPRADFERLGKLSRAEEFLWSNEGPHQTFDLDKTWHAIHYLLTGSPEPEAGVPGQAVLGGETFGEDQGYEPPRKIDPETVRQIAESLPDFAALWRRFDPRAFKKADLYPDAELWDEPAEELAAYVEPYYSELGQAYRRAAESGCAMVAWLA